jgi:hypothetical protein
MAGLKKGSEKDDLGRAVKDKEEHDFSRAVKDREGHDFSRAVGVSKIHRASAPGEFPPGIFMKPDRVRAPESDTKSVTSPRSGAAVRAAESR